MDTRRRIVPMLHHVKRKRTRTMISFATMYKRRRHTRKKRKQSGGAMYRPKRRLVDKIAEGASMFLAGPAPSFATLGLKLAGQAAKGIGDNVTHYRNRRRRRKR